MLNKSKQKNQSIIPYLVPASKQSEPDYFEEYQFMTNWFTIEHDGWRLPCTEEAHDWCGLWQTRGCLNEKAHAKLGYENKIFAKQFQRSCYRAVCKTCYKKWIARQANKATRRIDKYAKLSNRKPIHVLFSPPKWQYSKSVKDLRKIMNKILREVNLKGGATIFHSFRFNKKYREFYFSPHFHLIGFGYIQGIADAARKYGWFVKYLDVRKSVFQSFFYLLSHCGVKKGFHALVWLGDLSYSKLKLEKEPDSNLCPLCSQKLVPIYHEGEHSGIPPDEIFEGFVDSEGWYVVYTENGFADEDVTFEYDPRRQVNEILKGLAEAN